jgi:hypothetical protein
MSARTFSSALLSVFSDTAGYLLSDVTADAIKFEVKGIGNVPSAASVLMLDQEQISFLDLGQDGWRVARGVGGTTAAPHDSGRALLRLRADPPEIDDVLDGLRSTLSEIPEAHVRDALLGLVNRAGNDLDRWRKEIEHWFDDKMDRVSGWYKRRTKPLLFAIGLILVGVLNVDSVLLAKTFYTQPALRDSVVAAAERASQTGGQPDACKPPSANEQADPVACAQAELDAVKDLNIPIGWPTAFWKWGKWGGFTKEARVPHKPVEGWIKIAGLLITAFALTLGAPFWFDLLNKFINFRATGSPPSKTEDLKKTPA